MLQQSAINLTDLMKLIVPAVMGGIMGIVSAFFTMCFQQRAKKNEANAKVQIQYLNPLQLATVDLHDRADDIQNRLNNGDKLLRNTIQELKDRTHQGNEYTQWANDFGHYALSTLYLTDLYFAYVNKIRTDLPFIRLNSDEDRVLLDCLSRIRHALGGEFGIWENLQDSFGSYIRKNDGSLMNYKEFCTLIYNDTNFPWFIRLIDFYRDIDCKEPYQRQEMIDSLRALVTFLNQK